MALGVVLAGGCTVKDSAAPPSRVVLPARFAEAPVTGGMHADLGRWWTQWHDPVLDRLVDDALAANPDLAVARDHVRQARAYVAVARSALYPTVGATGDIAGGGLGWSNPAVPTALAPNLGDPATDGHLAGLAAAWEPDIFGGRAADLRAARAVAQSVEEQLHGTRMLVAADVVENYVASVDDLRRVALIDRAAAVLDRMEAYAGARMAAGQATRADIDAIRARRRTVLAARPLLVADVDTRRRRMAVLSGRLPEQAPAIPQPALFVIPPVPAGIVPVGVMERRPDIRARRDLVQAALERLRSARTDLLPRFGLEFFGGNGRLRFDGLPGLSGSGGLMALTTYLPIFTAGRIHAQIDVADARLDEAVTLYEQALLTALSEVESAYESRAALDVQGQGLAAALAVALRAAEDRLGLFDGGRSTLLDALQARLDAVAIEDAGVRSEDGRAMATIRLAVSLGGGTL
ncbi:TolC family protein [Gluconacetobacter tumulicola]|uniref:TolC family protein n=1 Tax=Gluconacetobacter tumulicola TaxID=1017177 RepID=A0A7W4P591_9PROT|nr:TolC family protein [Gluconacetobacter tumulicola]